MSILDALSERLNDSYNEHMKKCPQCNAVPVGDEPEGLCPNGYEVWNNLRRFNESGGEG